MTHMLSPRSIAMIGASNDEASIGGQVFANLVRSFTVGQPIPIHPTDEEVQGVKAYPSVAALPEPVDMVTIVAPPQLLAGALEECAASGVGGAVVIAPEFRAAGSEQTRLRQIVADIARSRGLGVIGPDSDGYFNIGAGVVATPALPLAMALPGGGPVALVAEGAGLGSYIAAKARLAGLRLGWFLSTGSEADVGVAGVLRHLVERDDVSVLMAYCEALRDPDVFVATAVRAVGLDKPLVVLKAGRPAGAADAAVFDAVCRQYGIHLVHTVEQMLDLGMIFQDGRRVAANRVGVVTASGGAGVLLADACALVGLQVPELPDDEQQAMRSFMPTPFYGSTTNPVDATAQGVNSPGAYHAVLNAVADSRVVDMIAPVTWAIPGGPNDALVDLYLRLDKPVAVTSTAWLQQFQDAGLPTYTDPQRAAAALSALARQSLGTLDFAAGSPFEQRTDRAEKARLLLASTGCGTSVSAPTSRQLLAGYGVVVQESPPGQLALLCRLRRDPLFGPVVSLGLGGALGELLGETALLRTPFGEQEVVGVLGSLFGGRLVASGRGLGRSEQVEMARIMVGMASLALELDEVEEIDVGPIWVGPGSVLVAGAVITLRQ
jgi:acyl-CoA synthetase (NDP forming)